MIHKYLNEMNCMGCKMCGDLCPKQAITFKINEEGFWYPEVDEEKCIKCGLCVKRCPEQNMPGNHCFMPEVYAAWVKDDDIRAKSTSGGMYYVFAKNIIDNGGYIVGSQYGEDWKSANHEIYNSYEGLEKLIGSKYFQSDTEGIYNKVKEKLDNGETVLFSGCPCQSAALQSFLNKDYDNLITFDFICRGINSPKVFHKYVSDLEKKYGSKVKKVRLRDKSKGWESLGNTIEFENGEKFYADKNDDYYVKGFSSENLYMRPSCVECKFKGLPRISDISAGDFWGIEGQAENEVFKGISVLMINSKKGKKFFDKIIPYIVYEMKDIKDAVSKNPCILYCVPKGRNRRMFFDNFEKMSFAENVEICSRKSIFVKCNDVLKLIYNRIVGKKNI